MANPNATEMAEAITSHLEFLGYEVEKVPTEDQINESLAARHRLKGSLIVVTGDVTFRLAGSFALNNFAKSHKQELLAFVNDLNGRVNLKFLVRDLEGDAYLEFTLSSLAPYERSAFGRLIDSWDHGIQMLNSSPDFVKFLGQD